MAKLYLRKIIAEEMTIDDVPERWREEVQALLNGEVPL
jgi:Zn-dependent M32 family carboxypeptidase